MFNSCFAKNTCIGESGVVTTNWLLNPLFPHFNIVITSCPYHFQDGINICIVKMMLHTGDTIGYADSFLPVRKNFNCRNLLFVYHLWWLFDCKIMLKSDALGFPLISSASYISVRPCFISSFGYSPSSWNLVLRSSTIK